MKNSWKRYAERGSMMVEALAMLGLITMVTPVLYKKAAERTTELQDINTASQMRTISKALDDYISDNYTDLSEGDTGTVAIDKNAILPYLPYGFDIDRSKMFDDFQFAIRNELIEQGTEKEHSAITGTVLAKSSNGVPMMRAAKIASMVGANGGVVNNKKVQGVQGGWGGNVSDFFGEGADAADGSLAVSSVHAVTSAGGGEVTSEHVLYRDDSQGVEGNTMITTLYMSGEDIEGVNKLIADADQIELVTNGGTVITDSNLEVGADATITGSISADSGTIANLLEAGSATINETLKAAGDALNVTSSDVTINPSTKTEITSPTVKVTGSTTITSDGGSVISATGNNVGINAGSDGNIRFNTNDLVIDGTGSHLVTINSGGAKDGGLAVTGGAAGADSASSRDFALAVNGSAYVANNARIGGDLYLGGSLDADKLYGRTELGGGKKANGSYNFVAGKDSVDIAGNNFTVGKWIELSGTKAKFGKQDEDGNMTGGLSVSSASGLTKLSGPGVYMQMSSNTATLVADGGFMVKTGDRNSELYSELSVATGGAYLRVKKGGDRRAFEASNLGTTLIGTNGSTETSTAPTLKLANGNATITADKMLVNSDNLKLNENKLVFDSNAAFPSDTSVRTSGVVINREGIIDLPRGTKPTSDSTFGKLGTPGYIRADRLVANKTMEDVSPNMVHYSGTGNDTTASKPYDAYQVNPAYTSVMHDIKLTTRGGARLSDILPDFINKGIYVLDNTYKEENGKENWENYTVAEGLGGAGPQVSNAPEECDSLDCIASPWLGFVPTPQCPPGYSKVITVNPIRWKMAQAYSISQVPPTSGDTLTRYNAYFTTPVNPFTSVFTLEKANNSATGTHTHTVEAGQPLTFQVNTWLNTTVSGVRKTGDFVSGGARTNDFLGWHAIMGFLYYADPYAEWIKKVSEKDYDSNYKGKVIWNLFPVLNQEMAAIADVYCYFERRNMTNPSWSWNLNVVDGGTSGYNQLTNFRSGYLKNNASYNERLNDPALGYDEVW